MTIQEAIKKTADRFIFQLNEPCKCGICHAARIVLDAAEKYAALEWMLTQDKRWTNGNKCAGGNLPTWQSIDGIELILSAYRMKGENNADKR